MDYYRRNLPHWQPKGAEFFVTFRLAGSLPRDAVGLIKEKRRKFRLKKRKLDMSIQESGKFEAEIFMMYDQLLDSVSSGPIWLSNDDVAQIVVDSIHFYDRQYYNLYAFTIMSNHVHLVFRHIPENYDVDLPVTGIMKLIKSFTGKECNKLLNRNGQFWQVESYDRLIRDEKELENVIIYTLNNPVKANLVSHWIDWPYTYCKPEFAECLQVEHPRSTGFVVNWGNELNVGFRSVSTIVLLSGNFLVPKIIEAGASIYEVRLYFSTVELMGLETGDRNRELVKREGTSISLSRADNFLIFTV